VGYNVGNRYSEQTLELLDKMVLGVDRGHDFAVVRAAVAVRAHECGELQSHTRFVLSQGHVRISSTYVHAYICMYRV
jgi:hypothetical protein